MSLPIPHATDDHDDQIPSYLLSDLEELGIFSRPMFIPTPAQLTIAAADMDFKKIKRINRCSTAVRRQQNVDDILLPPKPPSSSSSSSSSRVLDVNAIQKKLFINAVDSSLPDMHATTNMRLRE